MIVMTEESFKTVIIKIKHEKDLNLIIDAINEASLLKKFEGRDKSVLADLANLLHKSQE